ncbi:hypothetical protein [Streptomyces sp. SID13031]|uniref:hypothetical protein n=1 Tax=Streptomyces sp. SID13031 TaxID=2706046 RepID=UPI0013C62B28|nr:hypothetical protein [Streptomyces sp. SID13031]NEA33253.1 hypothetical protein [Streptomyces sp. SID13031]
MSSLETRHRQAQLVVSFIYLGIPVIFLGLVLWIGAAGGDAVDLAGALVPLAVLALGWWRREKSRYQPIRWSRAGSLMGGVTGLFTSYFTVVLDSHPLAGWFVLLAVVGAILGAGFGRYGFRVLMSPAIPELAESQYELSFRMRGLTRLRLSISADQVTLHEQMVLQTVEGDTTVREKSYPLTAVTGVYAVTLSGAERLKYPVAMKLAPASSPGPALILQAQGQDWVLPQNEAPAIAEILERRIATARTH